MAKIKLDPAAFQAWLSDTPTVAFMDFLEQEEFIRRQAMGEGTLDHEKYDQFRIEANVYKAIRQQLMYEDLVPDEEEDDEEISSDWKATPDSD